MILRALWLRPMLAGRARLVATAAGVAIGVASVVGTLSASRAAVASIGRDVDAVAGAARLEIARPGGVPVEDLARLRDLCGDALLVPVVEDAALAPALGELVRVLGVDPLVDAGVRAIELDPGGAGGDEDALLAARDALLLGTAAALPRSLADELGVAPGGELELVVRARPVRLAVAALFDPPRVASAWDRIVLVDVATAQELFGRAGRFDRVELRPRHELDLDALAADVAARLPPGTLVRPASERRAEGERMMRALDFNLTALSGVSVLVGMVLVATTLATSVVQRRKAIALLRSLGASRGQLARGVLLEAASIGLAGGLLGVALGWLGARAALASVKATAATVRPDAIAGEVELAPAWIAVGLALGVLSSLAAAVLPLREALRTPPIQGLRAERPESVALRRRGRALVVLAALALAAAVFASLPATGDRPFGALASALCLLSLLLVVAGPLVDLCAAIRLPGAGARVRTPLRVAQAALEAGRRRAAWAAGAVGVAVGLAVAMTAMVGSFRSSVVDWTQEAMRSDLFVRPLPTAGGVSVGGLDPEVVEIARRVFGAGAVDPFHQTTARVAGQPIALAGAAFDVVATRGGVPFLDGRPSRDVFAAAHARGTVLVNEPFARRFGVGRGDAIELETAAGTVSREVEGVYRDYSGHTGRAVLDRADFLALFPDEGPRSLAIFLPEGTDLLDARRELAAALEGRFALGILLDRELRAEVLAVFERTFAVTVALQLVASVVAALAVVTVLGALVRERRRELAVLRVLGGSRLQVAGVVAGQALLLGVAGALGGLGVGLVVGWVLVAIVNLQSFGWTLAFAPPWGSIAGVVGAVVPACLLAGWVPALIASRSTPREALRELA